MAKLDVLSIGSATRDLFLESAQFKIIKDPTFSTGEAECFALGSKVEIPTIVDETGGGATNSAVAFARLGLSAGAAIRIGRDHRGNAIAEEVRDHGVRVFATVDPRERTAISVLLLTRRGERTVLVHRGASANFTPRDIPKVSTRWYYVTSLAGSLPTIRAIWKRAKRTGARLAWNPGSDELEWGMKGIKPLLPGILISLNEFEAKTLTGETNAVHAARRLMALGAGTVLITAGRHGAVAADASGMYHSSIHNIPVTDTTGAGDAFGSGFVAGMIRGWNMTRRLQLATANSEGVIRHIGAKVGLRKTEPRGRERVRVEKIS